MSKFVTILTATTVFSLWISSESLAQGYAQNIHVVLEEDSNPQAFSRTGHFRRTAQGGYVSAGTWGNGEFSRAVLIRSDAQFKPVQAYRLNFSLPTLPGAVRWQESYGADVIQTGDSEYLLLAALNMNQWMVHQPGSQNLDFAVVKLRLPAAGGNAEILWAARYGGAFNDTPHSIEATADGGFIMSGYSNPEQALNLPSIALTLLVKIDAQGNLQWARRYRNNAAECRTSAFAVLPLMLRRPVTQTMDQGFVFTVHCDENVYIVKVNQQGDVLWAKQFESSGGFFDGFFNEAWNFGLGVAAGTGGTIIGVKETPEGNLAFLGNHFSFFATVWGNPAGGNGLGAALPMSYLFLTDAGGNFIRGAGFFRERSGDTSQPIEMTAHDFQPLPNGNFAVAAGIRQFCFNGPECSYTPALLDVDLRRSSFDEAVVRAEEPAASSSHLASHYPYALDFIRMAPIAPGGGVELSFSNQFLRLHGWADSQVAGGPCTQIIAGMRSFPIDIALQERPMTWTDLPGSDATVLTASPLSFSSSTLCLISSTYGEQTLPRTQEGIRVAPTVSNGDFELFTEDAFWLGADYALFDMQGKRLQQGAIHSDRQAIHAGHLPAGVYALRVSKTGRQAVLRMVVSHS